MINNILANLTDSDNISQHDKYLTLISQLGNLTDLDNISQHDKYLTLIIVDNLTDSDNVTSHSTIKFSQ